MCGLSLNDHEHGTELMEEVPSDVKKIWSISQNCKMLPTNAFGTIEFEGGPHPLKAQYLRCSFDTNPADIINHIQKVWKIEPPRLVVTIHGGMANFPYVIFYTNLLLIFYFYTVKVIIFRLQPKLARVFRKGLMKAAGIAGTWIITSGLDSCAVNHVTEALYGPSYNCRNKPITIGIAPWGLLKQKNTLVGQVKKFCQYKYNNCYGNCRTK